LNEDPEEMNLANESNEELTREVYNTSSDIDSGSITSEDDSGQNEISKRRRTKSRESKKRKASSENSSQDEITENDFGQDQVSKSKAVILKRKRPHYDKGETSARSDISNIKQQKNNGPSVSRKFSEIKPSSSNPIASLSTGKKPIRSKKNTPPPTPNDNNNNEPPPPNLIPPTAPLNTGKKPNQLKKNTPPPTPNDNNNNEPPPPNPITTAKKPIQAKKNTSPSITNDNVNNNNIAISNDDVCIPFSITNDAITNNDNSARQHKAKESTSPSPSHMQQSDNDSTSAIAIQKEQFSAILENYSEGNIDGDFEETREQTLYNFSQFWKEYLGKDSNFTDLSNRQWDVVEIIKGNGDSEWIRACLTPQERERLIEHERKMTDTTDELIEY
jgi:hypothetical protein